MKKNSFKSFTLIETVITLVMLSILVGALIAGKNTFFKSLVKRNEKLQQKFELDAGIGYIEKRIKNANAVCLNFPGKDGQIVFIDYDLKSDIVMKGFYFKRDTSNYTNGVIRLYTNTNIKMGKYFSGLNTVSIDVAELKVTYSDNCFTVYAKDIYGNETTRIISNTLEEYDYEKR